MCSMVPDLLPPCKRLRMCKQRFDGLRVLEMPRFLHNISKSKQLLTLDLEIMMISILIQKNDNKLDKIRSESSIVHFHMKSAWWLIKY